MLVAKFIYKLREYNKKKLVLKNNANRAATEDFFRCTMYKLYANGERGGRNWFRDATRIRSIRFAFEAHLSFIRHSFAGTWCEIEIRVSQVGEYVAAFIEFLGSETELSYNDIHILGHSLGAHVAGYIGNYVQKKIGRITGLDPAGPAFETPYLKDTDERLDTADANFVDIIHTCAGSLGFLRPIGHADFYPNGGTFRQPGCPIFSSRMPTLNFIFNIAHKRILI